VLAIAVARLMIGHGTPRLTSGASCLQATAVWRLAGFLLRGLIFLLLGKQIGPVARAMQDESLATVNVATAVSLAAALMLFRRMAVTEPRATAIADGRGGDDSEHGGDKRRRRPGGELPGVGQQQLDRDGRAGPDRPDPGGPAAARAGRRSPRPQRVAPGQADARPNSLYIWRKRRFAE
jgi:hypothetical protein